MKDRFKWVLAAILLLCAVAAAVVLLSVVRQFFHREPNQNGIVISVVEEETEDGTADGKEDTCDGERGDSWGEEGLGGQESEAIEGSRTERDEGDTDGKSGQKPLESVGLPPAPSREETCPTVWIISDLHYMSSSATDYGSAFEEFVSKCDGKAVRYLPEILDALCEEAMAQRPDALILTGDITMNGEKINHTELAGKLARVQDAGIQVLVIPGNHDINNPEASVYFGGEARETEAISPEEYLEFYGELGLFQAIDRDQASFSYVYALRDKVWLILLDTARYDPVNLVEGEVRPETLLWLEENLEAARKQGIQVLVLGHHNLLQESRMYTSQCVMDRSEEVTELLERYRVPLYLSGHLHLQRLKKHKKEPGATGYGIHEIVTDAFSIPPCRYGVLSWQEEGAVSYETRLTDVDGWAQRNQVEDENLLNFSEYQNRYLSDLIKGQITGQIGQIPEETAESMGLFYARIYADYCAGFKIDPKEVMGKEGYQAWERFMPDGRELDEIKAMIRDSETDANRFVFSEEITAEKQ